VKQTEFVIADFKTGFYRRDFLKYLGIATAGGMLAPWTSWETLAQESAATPKSGGEINISVGQNPLSFDGRNVSAITSFQIGFNFYNKLTRFVIDGSQLKIVGDLAESWEVADDGSITFHLLDGVKFHNGETLTAEDVAHTFNTTIDPSQGHSLIVVLLGLIGKEVVAKDRLTVVFPGGFSPLLAAVSLFSGIVNKKADLAGQDYVNDPIGTGPFKIVENIPGTRVVMERFEDYFKDGLPYLDKVTWNILSDDFARVRALESGTFQWISRVPLGLLDVIEQEQGLKVLTTPPGGFQWFLSFNVQRPPFDDQRLREAITWALDPQALIDVALFGRAQKSEGQIINGELVGFPVDVKNPFTSQPDLNRARQLVQELISDGVIPEGFTFPTFVALGAADVVRSAQIFKDQLAKIGLNLDIRQIQTAERFSHILGDGPGVDFGIQLEPFSGFVDHDEGLSPLFATKAFFNEGRWSDPETDRLLSEAASAPIQKKRAALYKELYEQVLLKQVPKYPYAWQEVPYAMVDNLMGFPPLINQETFFEQVWLAE